LADSSSSPQSGLGRIVFLEAEAIRRFAHLLRVENQALTDGDTDKLPGVASEKEEIAVRLKKLAEERNSELASQGHSADAQGIAEWRAAHPEDGETARAWDALLIDAKEANELNLLNGALIKARMEHSAKAIEILRHGDDPLELYGPDGQSKKHGIKRINDAA
jgi:flagella synthesis protein FlgN